MSFCSNCGNQLEDNARFCQYCGVPIQQESPVIPQNQQEESQTAPIKNKKEIKGNFPVITPKEYLNLSQDEVLIYQHDATFTESIMEHGVFSLTTRRIIFTKAGGVKSFLKSGEWVSSADPNLAASMSHEIFIDDIKNIEPLSCVQETAGMIITLNSDIQYRIVLQNLLPLKTAELCQARDRIVTLIKDTI